MVLLYWYLRPIALDKAIRLRRPGPYQIQAAISGLHAQAKDATETDWPQIALLYRELTKFTSSSVVKLNQAVAITMADGPLRGLNLLNELEASGNLDDYYLFHAARADLFRRVDQLDQADQAYTKALALTQNDIERTFLQDRLKDITQTLHNLNRDTND